MSFRTFYYYLMDNVILERVLPIALGMTVTLILSLLIYVTYKYCYRGVSYSRNFNLSLIMMSLVTAVVMMVIGSNIALSLGMVGALSIVRFRTAVKDPRDTVYIFWSISVGLACGVEIYDIAIIGSLFIAVVVFIFSINTTSREKYLLVIRGKIGIEENIYSVIFKQVKHYKVRSRTINNENMEIVCEVRLKKDEDIRLINRLSSIEGIKSMNLVSQSGEMIG
ncbi:MULTISPECIES: DUF4956 domain-containing protein [Clostridium]|uniref:DUF4956 domain-containing protein n=1 Tax=Clostridium TaxID=1485 RepID=UPI001897AB02|nr:MULTISPECIES: DUF4956 domain-containing protein [Clostridium]MCR1951597.1 DUF4956 domain-containing protein [Clostridium sp. DSM 100503]MDI9218705.1 DUF4956 domain-containing protein [Clostridium tertium]